MSYGLQVKSFDAGGNELIQIDTELGLTNFVITQMGTGSSVNVGAFTGKTRFVFVKPRPGATDGTSEICLEAGAGGSSIVRFRETYVEQGISDQNSWQPISVDFMVVEDVTAVAPVGDYGLQTLSAGGETSFDSRKITVNASFSITRVVPAGSVGGYGSFTTDVISTDNSEYINLLPWSYWDDRYTKAGIVYKTVNGVVTSVAHIDQEFEVAQPGDIQLPPNFYDNYSPIMIATVS
jgi:hypothetical protein